jgi:hypothetical protein
MGAGFLLGSGDAPPARATRPAEPAAVVAEAPRPPDLREGDAHPELTAAAARAADTDAGQVAAPPAWRERLLQLEETLDPAAADELLRIGAQLPEGLAEDYARAAAAQAALLASAEGASEASARLAEAALRAIARRLAAAPSGRGESWRAARVVLERLGWIWPEIPADLRGPVEAMRTSLEGALMREAEGPPSEATAEALALAEVIGGENIARAALEVARRSARDDGPRTREGHLVLSHAVRAAMLHGDVALRTEARAWLGHRLARARSPDEQLRMRELLDSAPR